MSLQKKCLGILLLFSWCALVSSRLDAQAKIGLVAHYPFESNLFDITGNTANVGMPLGEPGYGCGVEGDGLLLDGVNDKLIFTGPIKAEFDTEDFTVSFYFKPGRADLAIPQYILSKRRTDCSNENSFYIRYVPSTKVMQCYLGETPNRALSIIQPIKNLQCWQLVTVMREGVALKLYLNGEFAQEIRSNGRLNVLNDGDLILGAAECEPFGSNLFGGVIDELRFYNRALKEEEVKTLYFAPDKAFPRDTAIFLGGTVPVTMNATCGADFNWSPLSGVFGAGSPDPLISPIVSGDFFYYVNIFSENSTCIAKDSVRINVIDPQELNCNELFLPKAFTPNGDNLNDTYGISNPYVMEELISFEIFDRWGSLVFGTRNPFGQWDGSFKGQPMNPGVLLYRVKYRCQGEEKIATGSLSIMR